MAKSASQPHQSYEFFGPHGTALLILAMPLVVLALPYGCNARGCLQLYPKLWVPGFAPNQPLYTHAAMAAVAGWFGLVLALHLLLPGQRARGVVLPDGSRLTYKLNGASLGGCCELCISKCIAAPEPRGSSGICTCCPPSNSNSPSAAPYPPHPKKTAFSVFVVTYGSALALSRFGLGVLDLTWLAANFVPLLTASVIFSTALAVAVHAASFLPGPGGGARTLSAHGASGWPWYDFWMGRELNPRWLGGAVDVKEFCELYPGMIGWALLNLAFAARQAEAHGVVGVGMALVNAFQLWYVADGLVNERSILTTMDITTDGFGFMLSFGDLCWVPFTFATQARYLADHPQPLGVLGVAAVLAVQGIGYYIFRGANGQKDAFRQDPKAPAVAHLKSMPTARGTRLITSGWWGAARHINYLGDWIMGLAWCMPCGAAGAASVIPYFYCLYFASLLVHRERRDEAACRAKYGRDWDRYCALVPWRIVPRVY
jgi:delta14-sterol reductase